MKFSHLLTAAITLLASSLIAQNAQDDSKERAKTYQGGKAYAVPTITGKPKGKKPKNIILMIGDGMGLSQVFAGLTANGGHLYLENFKHVGFSKTSSQNAYITDSASGATALSAGVKTYNKAIGVKVNSQGDTAAVKTVLEIAEEKGMSTGLVSTSSITHATPASFIAHQPNRNMTEEIAADFLKTDIDVFIGGGYDAFANRKDMRDLTKELAQNNYQVLQDMDEISRVNSGKLAGLTAPDHNPRAAQRNEMLSKATKTALYILVQNRKGFFLMVEGSQIDWGGHDNNTDFIVGEMLDFDQVIGQVLEFAARDRETLIVITADHETGGLSLVGGDMETGMVKGAFSTGGHTAVMVPIFAFGPGADQFTGIMENNEIGQKLIKFLEK